MNMNFPQNISKATVSDGIANWYHGNVDEKKKKKVLHLLPYFNTRSQILLMSLPALIDFKLKT